MQVREEPTHLGEVVIVASEASETRKNLRVEIGKPNGLN